MQVKVERKRKVRSDEVVTVAGEICRTGSVVAVFGTCNGGHFSVFLPLINSTAGDREEMPIPATCSAGYGELSSQEIVQYEETDEHSKNDDVHEDNRIAKGID